MENSGTPLPAERQPSPGCIQAVLASGTVLWVFLASAVAMFLGWLLEQTLFEGSLEAPDLRWLVQLVYAVFLLLPLGIIVTVLRKRGDDRMYLSWLLAAGFSILVVPSRLLKITASQGVAVLQAGGLILLILVLLRILSEQGKLSFRNQGAIGLATGFGLLLLLPWVMYGALGSVIDVLLNLLTAGLLGFAASLTLYAGILRPDTRPAGIGPVGLAALVMLLILVTGLGQNGTQWLLALSVPAAGWAAAAAAHAGHQQQPEQQFQWAAPAVLVSLAAAGPLCFVDPDELMLVISSAPGDLLGWALRAAWLAFLLAAVLSLLLALAVKALGRASQKPMFGWGIPLASLLVVTAVYITAGQPGLYGEQLFVVMEDQADVSAAAAEADLDARRAEVYETLVSHAEASQAELSSALRRFGIQHTPYYLVNGLEVHGGPLLRLWLGAQPGVDRVLQNPHLRPLPAQLEMSRGSASAPQQADWNLEMIHAPRVWSELGVTGEGIVVGQSDSGVQGDHPEVADSFLTGDRSWYDPWYQSTQPQDFGGHGTHTLGSILGNQAGVAPDASWIGCVNLARNLGNPAFYLDCMQFMLAPFPAGGDPFHDGDPSLAADVLNNSWGCPEVEGCDAAVFQPAVRAIRDAGIFMVVSAGNSGYGGCGTVQDPPAIYDEVYSVGSVNEQGELSDFSSRGPVTVDGSRRVKPDILAPGEGVTSSFPGSTYETTSGTSMAGPHVAGVVALMWSANPDLAGQIEQTEQILNETAQPFTGLLPLCASGSGYPKNGIGYGVVDAFSAVQRALEYRR